MRTGQIVAFEHHREVSHMEGPAVSINSREVSELVSPSKALRSRAFRKAATNTLGGHLPSIDSLGPAECLAQVERLVDSPQLRDSQGLSKLLRYLAEHTLNSPEGHLKEYQIATEVLGRRADFDPQSDAGVRVQVGRLRNRLHEYYLATGAPDPVLITIPKGGYALGFARNKLSAAEPDGPRAELDLATPPARSRCLIWALCLMAISTSLVTAACVFCFFQSRSFGVLAAQTTHAPTALQTFWGPFLYDQGEPFVVFSNASFVGDPLNGMRYYDSSRDSLGQASAYYTGVGEVMGAVRLEQLFQQFGRAFRLERSGLFNLDDARDADLIFLGSPTENPPLRRIPNTHEFIIRRLPSDKTRWSDVVVLHPRADEPSVYHSTLRPTSPVNDDYAIIAFVHGLDPNRHTLILEGISTLGTQAAVDYMCEESSVAAILHQLNVRPGEPVPFFEALVKVRMANDVPLQTELISVRRSTD